MKIRNALFALTLVALPAVASAQGTSNTNINATGTIAAVVTATAGKNLEFGAMTAGTAKSVLLTDAAAGAFGISSNTAVSVSVALPATISNAAGATIPLSGAACGRGADATAAAAVGGTFACGTATQVIGATGGTVNVYVAATATPAAAQPAGTYTGTVTMTSTWTTF